MSKKGKTIDDYEVGYGKPPKHSRFKPGKSGNPKGRPKGAKNLRTMIGETLFKKMKVTEDGCTRTMSRFEAVVTGLLSKALKGDPRAAETVLKLAAQYCPSGEDAQPMQIFIQRFTDGEILGELEPQPDGRRKLVPQSEKNPWSHLREVRRTPKATDDDSSDDNAA